MNSTGAGPERTGTGAGTRCRAAIAWVSMTDKSTHLGDAQGEWYYCFKHKKVETRDECRKMDRMGPYSTVADAENWRERVVARNEEWENEEQ